MAKKVLVEYKAKVTNDSGIVRGKIPSPLVKELGARPGDFIVFRSDGGKVTVGVTRTRSKGKSSAKKRAGKKR